MVTKGLNKITQNETQDLQLVDNFCKSWGSVEVEKLESEKKNYLKNKKNKILEIKKAVIDC